MFEDESRVPDRGPWSAKVTPEGRLVLDSDDFHHDAQVTVSGDFGSPQDKLQYGQYLADILTRGCRRMQASRELQDEAALLQALTRATSSPERELLERAADEVARLQIALAEAEETLRQLQAHQHHVRRVVEAQQPSAFAMALKAALNHR